MNSTENANATRSPEHFVNLHLAKRKGERLRRLQEGHGHAERLFLQHVWLPAFGQFDDLHPEYEIKDFRDGSRFIDFAFLRFSLKLAIEIDGYTSHASQISRTQFSDQLSRQNHLILDGWKILRFTYDDVKDRPRMCIQLLQQFMGRFLGASTSAERQLNMSALEKEIVRYALNQTSAIKPADVSEQHGISRKKAYQVLKHMASKSILQPAGNGTQSIRGYKLHELWLTWWERNNHVI
ncbi:DUF559 domain-containing protein [Paenibacillus roseipurpureus]|uniref:DUF559 domain-containing protein n=1 Tax=Paenibacillus roseopurpureus TaxID=2918901 RepID=A0AA96RIZ2_9BACL|nr:DUF559 domain-containing protein [Paenibacillus sp. MBLB1832]WNR43310.1 DUF559 domain-containing protein [Paenibacillus sp. MBLB1832]